MVLNLKKISVNLRNPTIHIGTHTDVYVIYEMKNWPLKKANNEFSIEINQEIALFFNLWLSMLVLTN